MTDTENICDEASYQITVANIKYGRSFSNKFRDRPEIVTLDVPESILKLKTKGDETKFKDAVESFAYNTVSRKFAAEVSRCQVWLPLEDK